MTSLSEKDTAIVRTIWGKISKKTEEVGKNALSRTVVVYPQTNTSFAHWQDLSENSHNVKKHRVTIMNAVSDAVTKIDDLKGGLLSLSELHGFTLHVDPANFMVLSLCILMVMAIMFPIEFPPEVHVSLDKVLASLAVALSEKYR